MADPTTPSPYSENKRFEPKNPVELNVPKDDVISVEELSKCDGMEKAGFRHHRIDARSLRHERLTDAHGMTNRHESG